jgi:uncharacterized LabA/DUF88 family protein
MVMLNTLPEWMTAVPPFRRMMIFIDGENLVLRYQEMCEKGWKPRNDNTTHIKDVVIWHDSFSYGAHLDEVLRATYYTSTSGSPETIESIKKTIKSLTFTQHRNSRLPNNLTPRVIHKPDKSRKTRVVDIHIAVDVLGHVYRNNVDVIILLTGDGDYVSLINEIQKIGKQCYISAFSSGLNEELKYVADKFYCLDGTMFPEGRPTGEVKSSGNEQ